MYRYTYIVLLGKQLVEKSGTILYGVRCRMNYFPNTCVDRSEINHDIPTSTTFENVVGCDRTTAMTMSRLEGVPIRTGRESNPDESRTALNNFE